MKKLLLIISLIFIQHCFGQQNFLKKSELRDSLDAYNFQNDGLNDSLALIRGEISDTSATLRQVIMPSWTTYIPEKDYFGTTIDYNSLNRGAIQ